MLTQLLEKLGITNFDQLTAEERKTYEQWAKVLTTQDVTMDTVKAWLNVERARANTELLKIDNTKERELFYKVMVRMLDALHVMTATPAAQRESLKTHLQQVFHIDV